MKEPEFKLEDEEPINRKIGYPYNIIPKGYPNKISNSKINDTIDKVLRNLLGNAGIESIVIRDTAFINLGLNELSNRQNRKQSKLAFGISICSIILATLALLFTYAQFQVSMNQIDYQHENNVQQRAIWEYEKMRNDRLEARDNEWRKQDLENR